MHMIISPVTPRGQVQLILGAVHMEDSSTCKMNKILELDEENLTITVEPSTHMDLIKVVAEHGLMYPPDPGEKCLLAEM